MSRYVIGFVTCASRPEARRLARAVLAGKLAACVNILSGVESHYWWQGKLARSKECLLMIKTTGDKTNGVMKLIRVHHSYDTPEIIFTPIVAGAGDQAAGAIGMGITRPGAVSVTIGTSGVVFAFLTGVTLIFLASIFLPGLFHG